MGAQRWGISLCVWGGNWYVMFQVVRALKKRREQEQARDDIKLPYQVISGDVSLSAQR